MQEAEDRAKELDAAHKSITDDENARIAQAKKEWLDAEWKRRYNEYEGIVHEDDGSNWNLGDGMPVGGVNKYLKLKNHHHHKNKKHQSFVQKMNLPVGGTEVADRNFIRDKENAIIWGEIQRKQQVAEDLK